MATVSVRRHGQHWHPLAPGGRICKALSPYRDLPRRLLQPGNHSGLALGAIIANWSQTLDALAGRGAGKEEAKSAKISVTVRTDRARLERIERERAPLPNVSATDETVKAAQAAVFAAERAQRAECDKRGRLCREREGEEAAKRDALSKVLENKATADKAAKLDREIAELSARLAKAPPVKENSAGKTLGSLLSLSAVSAATFQQQFFSAIVELAIAAALALPELLRPKQPPATRREGGEGGKARAASGPERARDTQAAASV